MKGLLYNSLTLNKKWFIGAGIAALVSAVLGVVLELTLGVKESFRPFVSLITGISPIIVMAILSEYPPRDIVGNMKCRFAEYSLCAGISRNEFVLAQLVINLIFTLLSAAVGCLLLLIYQAADSSFVSASSYKLFALTAVFVGVLTWIIIPLTIALKDQEKAGLVVGLIIGVPVGIGFSIILGDNGETLAKLMELLSNDLFPLICAGIVAAVYALVYLITYALVKRGDLR